MLGVEALTFLAADQERLGDFLAASGIGYANLREAASEPGFLSGMLRHLASDDQLLIAFAAHLNTSPEALGQAIARATGAGQWDST